MGNREVCYKSFQSPLVNQEDKDLLLNIDVLLDEEILEIHIYFI